MKKDINDEIKEMMEKINLAILSELTSGDHVFKSLMEGYEAKKENQRAANAQEGKISESHQRMNEAWDKMFHDERLKELLGKQVEAEKTLFGPLKINRVAREDNREADGSDPLLLHEIAHTIDFEKDAVAPTVDSRNVTNVHTEQTFSTDYDKYNEQVENFLDYIAMIKEVEDFAVIRVKRINNVIRYSRYKQGMPVDRNEITMVSSVDLRALYETLKISYGAEFVPGSKHEMMRGWSLLPTIGEKIMLEIDSDNLEDKKWIYNEAHNQLTVVEEPKHK